MIRDLMCHAGPALGLKAPVLATLDILLSFLPPQRDHHMVFASNAAILERSAGLSERSLRRHITLLQEAGLLARQDSPNRKRFCRRQTGSALRFGFDLGPLFDRLPLIAELAAQSREEAQQIALLKLQIRTACQRRLLQDDTDTLALTTLPLLRRKLAICALEDIAASFTQDLAPSFTEEAPVMAANHGENGRHHKNNKSEIKYKDPQQDLTICEILDACPETTILFPERPKSWADLNAAAKKLKDAIGIPSNLYQSASDKRSEVFVAVLIWTMIEKLGSIRNPVAYFTAMTIGSKAALDAPFAWISARLSADKKQDFDNIRQLQPA